MSTNSINTNTGAIIALQNLNITASELQTTQNRISTGLSVSSAKDNGAIWGIAQNSRASISSLDAVKQSLQRAQSTVDVAVSAGQTISDLLNQIKSKALAGSDTSLDTVSRKALNNDVSALIAQIQKITSTADFNGTNIIKTSGASIYALANASGSSKLTVQGIALGEDRCRQVAEQRHGCQSAAGLLGNQHRVQRAKADSAVLLRHEQTGPPGCRRRLPQVGPGAWVLQSFAGCCDRV